MPETRSSKSSETLTEHELRALQKQLSDRERRLREESDALDRERQAFDTRNVEKERLREELETMRRELETIRSETPANFHATPQNSLPSNEPWEYTLKEAASTIPPFDGQNMSVLQFARACRRAREILPESAERTLARLIVTKLRGRAATAIEDEPISNVTSLCNRLKEVFGPNRSVDHYRGEMANIYMGSNEHILDYISRVKDLRDAILDCSRSPAPISEINALTVNSFIDGLTPLLRPDLRPYRDYPLSRTFDEAIRAFKQAELDRKRYDRTETRHVRFNENRDGFPERRPVSPPRRPVTPPPATWRAQSPYRYGDQTPRNPPRTREEYRYRPDPREQDRRDPARYRTENYERNSTPRTYNNSNRSNTPSPVCSYCQYPGHDVHQCRKRAYANAQPSGNGRIPPPNADRRREEGLTRPVRTMTTTSDTPESQLSD